MKVPSRNIRCPLCKKVHRTMRSNGICESCINKKRPCEICHENKIIFIKESCEKCYKESRARIISNKLIHETKITYKYNRYIFDLYLKYFNECQITYSHIKEMTFLLNVLKNQEIVPYNSWSDIYRESAFFKVQYDYHSYIGCPFIKIGHMLYELGILKPKSEDNFHRIQNHLTYFPRKLIKTVENFVIYLNKSNRSNLTIESYVKELKKLNEWAEKKYQSEILSINNHILNLYFQDLKNERPDSQSLLTKFHMIKKFYSWCLLQKLILNNPCIGIKIAKPLKKITICSKEQFDALFNFIKGKNSNPKEAFIIYLILFQGLTKEDLRFAKIIIDQDNFNILLRRKPLTYSKRYYNRENIISLSQSPSWLLRLQKNFYNQWQLEFQKSKQPFSSPQLILPKGNRFIRPCHSLKIQKILKKITIEIAGQSIPYRVLHQTCGYIYASKNDSSVLTHLGWSKISSFNYTWVPKVIFSTKK